MGGHVLIIDADDARRAELRRSLGLREGEVADLADPRQLAQRVGEARPDLLLLDAGGLPALAALRALRARGVDRLPAIALVPGGRPDLRLAALDAGADDATERGTPFRILQARIRSLLRQRDDATALAPRDDDGALISVLPGLAEAAAAFDGPSPGTRVGLLATRPAGAAPPADAIARLLDAEVTRLACAADAWADDFDLVLIDGAGTRGDLIDGARVLSILADLQAHQRGGPASTLVLLPSSAVETAALSLDLGAGDVVTGPVAPREVALRAQALVARRRMRRALRDQVRLGLRDALIDPLTGLHNRRYAEAALPQLGDGGPLAVLVADIDHFKAINDGWGHPAGDRVLRGVAQRLRAALRPTDLLARIGGEEFLIALPGAGQEEAAAVAERLRRAIDAEAFALADAEAPTPFRRGGEATVEAARVTVSIGVAAAPAPAGPAAVTTLLHRADAALFEAKRQGRNAVAVSAAA